MIRMEKLTLSVDARVISRAKHYAKSQETSVSRLVERMLDLLATPRTERAQAPPVLARLRGSLSRADIGDYRKHLEAKYK
jgi:hypothetical protein